MSKSLPEDPLVRSLVQAARKAQLTNPFADGGAVNPITMELQHQVAVGFNGRGGLGRWW